MDYWRGLYPTPKLLEGSGPPRPLLWRSPCYEQLAVLFSERASPDLHARAKVERASGFANRLSSGWEHCPWYQFFGKPSVACVDLATHCAVHAVSGTALPLRLGPHGRPEEAPRRSDSEPCRADCGHQAALGCCRAGQWRSPKAPRQGDGRTEHWGCGPLGEAPQSGRWRRHAAGGGTSPSSARLR